MNFETVFKKVMIYILIIVIIIFGFKLVSNLMKVNQLEDNLIELQEEVDNQIKKNNQLQEEIQRVRSLEYIERVAREELGLVKPGEILFIPVEEDEDNQGNKKSKE
ncbi:MAG: septum formation initiator family protein [Halanaerobiales bacterium]|nr:septum formation initiator family protein [Halanaerobiales bacterium]